MPSVKWRARILKQNPGPDEGPKEGALLKVGLLRGDNGVKGSVKGDDNDPEPGAAAGNADCSRNSCKELANPSPTNELSKVPTLSTQCKCLTCLPQQKLLNIEASHRVR